MSLTSSSIEEVYGYLIVAFRDACGINEDKELADRIDGAIRLFEQLWPEACAKWREHFK